MIDLLLIIFQGFRGCGGDECDYLIVSFFITASKGKAVCERTAGYFWGVPYDAIDVTKAQCLVALPKPECKEAPWSRSVRVFCIKLLVALK
jgi:hypothetical protein